MRTLEKADTPILTGMQIYHNYVRAHQALGGRTLSEAVGVKVQGESKWLTLIQNAAKKKKASIWRLYGNFLKAFFTCSSGKARKLIIFTASTESELSNILRAASSLGTSRISMAS